MKSKIKVKFAIILSLLMVISTSITAFAAIDVPLKEKFNYGTGQDISGQYNLKDDTYYSTILKGYEKSGYKPANDQDIIVGINDIKVPDNIKPNIKSNIGGNSNPVFIWDNSTPWVEWEFNVKSQGLYQIGIDYYMLQGSSSSASRSIEIDGKVPFLELNNIRFDRMWKDKNEPVVNSIGDEVRPSQIEVSKWRNIKLSDCQGVYSEPFEFYFEPGKHKVRFKYIEQEMVIGNIYIKPSEIVPSYEQVKEQYKTKGYKEATKSISFQAESTVIEKNDQTIRRETNGDPLCQPESSTNRKLNVIGDWRWRIGNQSITWQFDAPEDGLYKIDFRVAQYWNDGLPSFRQIAIDGKVPFKEIEEYQITYNKNWRIEELHDLKNNPYLFYFTKGTHNLTMTVKLGYLGEIARSLNSDALKLSEMIREILKITGNKPDPNYNYDFMDKLPDLNKNIKELVDSLQNKYDILKSNCPKLPAMANNFITIRDHLNDMIKDPFTIAKKVSDLNNDQASLGTWFFSIQNQPAVIDYFSIEKPNEKIKNSSSNVFQKLKSSFDNFLVSFKKDYDNVGSTVGDNVKVDKVINIWVARGTEWAEQIKEMADADFTPKTGIMINMNVMPSSQLKAGSVNALMLSITSGKAPDVALGVDSSSPVEFAIRDAAYDLTKFDNFNEVAKRFIPNIFIPYRYLGGVYALPETMDFTAMFYRKDIVSELGIKIPNTREELYDYVLPRLYQNGLQFYYPADFTQFIFQNGADFYSPDGKKSGLDTSQAYIAFKECTQLYTNYGIPIVSNFYNRFRTGEMPIGIGGYSAYIQLSVAAPELAGRWAIAPLPGVRKEDGTIDRSNGALAGQCDIILNQTKNPEAAWEFLNWWSSSDVQTRFAKEIEASIGTEARWNTANVQAFESLSWKKEDLDVIKKQWEWAKETPVVLGGYFTGRHITNAWNRIVVNGENVRDSIEEAVEDINRELKMKQEEYGVTKSQR